MNIGQISSWVHAHPSHHKGNEELNIERLLVLLAEGTAQGMPEIDKEAYRQFRTSVAPLTIQLSDRISIEEKLALVRAILHEFEQYRNHAMAEIRDRRVNWRMALEFVLRELLERMDLSEGSPESALLTERIPEQTSAKEIHAYQKELVAFLHPVDAQGRVQEIASPLKLTDRSKANDNASGLPGGGSAIEHLQQIIDRGGAGFVAFFRLGCMAIISERFGVEAAQDCLMEMAAYLTRCLRGDDTVYHWSDSSLLAILLGRANERVVHSELKRIVMQNRDIAIQVDNHELVLRVPLEFELFPIRSFHRAEELHHILPGALLTGAGI